MTRTITLVVEKGGKGSGFHGHAGRPGKRGGSTSFDTNTEFNARTMRIWDEVYLPQRIEEYKQNNPGHDITKEEYVARCNEWLKKYMQDTYVVTRVTAKDLDSILDDGEFKSVVESKRSGAATYNERGKKKYYINHRLQAEYELLGIPKDQVADRPVYGYITYDENGRPDNVWLASYGDVAVFMKDDIKDRTTFTTGDSLDSAWMSAYKYKLPSKDPGLEYDIVDGGRAIPSLMTNPDVHSEIMVSAYTDVLSFYEKDYNTPEKWKSTEGNLMPDSGIYWETQMHGGITVKDIDHVVFLREPDDPAIYDKLSKLDIPYTIYQKKA